VRTPLPTLRHAIAVALAALLAAPAAASAAWPEQRTIATGLDDVVGTASASAGLLAWHSRDAAPTLAVVRPDGTVTPEPTTGLAPGDFIDDVALTDEGTAVLCLRRPRPASADPALDDVLVAVRRAGGRFAAPRQIAAPSTEVSGLTCDVADDGDAIAGWVEGDALDDGLSSSADGPSLDVSPSHRTRVAWGDRRRVHHAERRSGRVVRRQVATTTSPWSAVFGWTPGGTLLTAWLDEPVEPDVSRRRVRAVHARPGRRERVLDLGLARGPGGPFVGLGPDGSGAVAWEDETRLFGRRLGRTGTPGHRALLGPVADQTHPAVLAWSRGRSAIAWVTRDRTLVIR
jgi:hypothetical protein